MINRDGMKEEEERENEILIENNLPSSCLHSHGHTSHGCTNQDLNNMMTKQTLFLSFFSLPKVGSFHSLFLFIVTYRIYACADPSYQYFSLSSSLFSSSRLCSSQSFSCVLPIILFIILLRLGRALAYCRINQEHARR